jgi:FtsH-binding integral membrane protein
MSDADRKLGTVWGRPVSRAEPSASSIRACGPTCCRSITTWRSGWPSPAWRRSACSCSVTGDPATAARTASGAAARVGGMYLTQFGYYLFVSPLKWAVILAPLGLVFALSFGIERMRPATAQIMFWVFSALMGVSLSSIFLIYTHTSIVRVFFITAASFGALSLYGYTTKRDLSGMGSFLMMGLFGLIIASLVNLFLQSSMMQFIVSVVGVLIFAGLTAWDTQRLKNDYIYGGMDGEATERSAIMGALSLYLNFINLFTFLMQLLGQKNE